MRKAGWKFVVFKPGQDRTCHACGELQDYALVLPQWEGEMQVCLGCLIEGTQVAREAMQRYLAAELADIKAEVLNAGNKPRPVA